MKKYLGFVAIALFATVVAKAGSDADALLAREKAAWQAFKDKKADDFKKIVHADFRGVYAQGMATVQTEIDDMQKWNMKSFAISDYKVTSSGDDVVTTYKVDIDGTLNGNDQSGTYNAASVWKKVKGEWQAIFHTNIKAETTES